MDTVTTKHVRAKVPVRKKTWAELSDDLSALRFQNQTMRRALVRIMDIRGGITDKIARRALVEVAKSEANQS